jgi:hypothetical protein
MLVGLCIKPPLQHAKFSRMREAPAIQKSAKAKSGWLNAEQPAFFSSQSTRSLSLTYRSNTTGPDAGSVTLSIHQMLLALENSDESKRLFTSFDEVSLSRLSDIHRLMAGNELVALTVFDTKSNGADIFRHDVSLG